VAVATPPSGCTTDWYTVATGGTAIATGNNTLTTPSALTAIMQTVTMTYYAESRHIAVGCRSTSRTSVVITVSLNVKEGPSLT
jgi:hypothetical protein